MAINKDSKSGRFTEEPHKSKTEKRKALLENLKSFGTAILLVLVIRSCVVEAFKIPTGSMIPTLMVGDHIFVNKFAYGFKIPFSDVFTDRPINIIERKPPQRGDVIVFKYPKDPSIYYVKRVIGVPKDKVSVRNKIVYLNGKPLERVPLQRPDVIASIEGRDYDKDSLELFDEINLTSGKPHFVMIDKNSYLGENYSEVEVPEDHLFVMGDNRDYSSDSRIWGFVPYKLIRGQALFVWMSIWIDLENWKFLFSPSRIGTIVK